MCLLCLPAPLLAQPPEYLHPVDQAVEDLDPLARSFRRVERGLRADGEQTSLFKLRTTGPRRVPIYYRIAPGFNARVDRLDYLVWVGPRELAYNNAPLVDGEFLEVIGPNTVFELRPLESLVPPLIEPFPSGPDMRIDARIEARIDGRIDGRIDVKSGRVRTPSARKPVSSGTKSPPDSSQPASVLLQATRH